MLTKLIEQYKIKYLSGSAKTAILLKDYSGNIGMLVFYHDAASLPPDREREGVVTLNYYLREFENVLRLLELGRPVYLRYAGNALNDENGILVGEDEPGWLRSEEDITKLIKKNIKNKKKRSDGS
jgi:hypothetical protein